MLWSSCSCSLTNALFTFRVVHILSTRLHLSEAEYNEYYSRNRIKNCNRKQAFQVCC